ncbi:MAG: hypothetical protein AAGA83_25140 [Cyanobacteria bacterium P01_F01_bin.116]
MQTLEDLFQELLLYRDRTLDPSSLGPWLQHKITTCTFPNLNHIPFATETYTRNWIARESTTCEGFEALIMRWDKQAQTSIHGHPAFSFYHVISGVFEMELFSFEAVNCLKLKENRCFYPSDTTWCLGQVGRYDNFIHRITCLEAGLTFHVYSEDAQKGMSLS